MSDELLMPLRAVSKDPTNITKLDADDNILTSTTDIATTFVQKAGDTMTGPLAVTAGATMAPPATAISTATVLHVVREGGSAFIETYNAGSPGTTGLCFRRKTGTMAAPAPVNANTPMGVVRWLTKPSNGAADRTTAQISLTATSAETNDGYFDGTLGITCVGATAAQAATWISLVNTAAGVRSATISCGTFTTDATNFTVTTSGYNTNRGGLLLVADNAAAAAGTAVVQLQGWSATNPYTGVQSLVTGVGSDHTGFYASCTGTSTGTAIAFNGIARSVGSRNVGLRVDVGGATSNYGILITDSITAGDNSYGIISTTLAKSAIVGYLGVGWYDPTHQLEVAGESMLRGTLEVAGNITSSGTAHSFAAGSIPSSAVIGAVAFTPANSTAPGAAGAMRWDANYLYICVAANSWKRVALTTF